MCRVRWVGVGRKLGGSCLLMICWGSWRRLLMIRECCLLYLRRRIWSWGGGRSMRSCWVIIRVRSRRGRRRRTIWSNMRRTCRRNWCNYRIIYVNWHMLIMIWWWCSRDIRWIIYFWRRIYRRRILWLGFRRRRLRSWRTRIGNWSSIIKKIGGRKGFRGIWRWEFRRVWGSLIRWRRRRGRLLINPILLRW